MTKLINVDELKQYIGDCKCCEKCPNKGRKQYECYYDCKFPDYLTKEWERVLDEQPTVDAIPIDFIEKKIDEYREKEDQTKDEPLSGYFDWVRTSERRSLEWLLLDWKAEPDEQNEET